MPDTDKHRLDKPIFRAEAIQFYTQKVNQAVMPRFITQRVFNWLWFFILLLIIIVGLIVLNLSFVLPQDVI